MKRLFAMLAGLAILGVVAGSSRVASAQDESLDEAARITFEAARDAFVAGDYENALARFRQAYDLSQRPGLLYNIAQTLDRLRRDEETVQALRDYLTASPDARNRSEVEARIRVLEQSLSERAQEQRQNQQQQASSGTTTNVAPVESNPLAILHPAFFIGAGVLALAAGGLTIYTGLETQRLNDEYNAAGTYETALPLYDEASSFQLLTNVFIISTAVLGALAAAFAVITDWDAFGGGSERAAGTVRPMLGVGPDGGSLGLMGHL